MGLPKKLILMIALASLLKCDLPSDERDFMVAIKQKNYPMIERMVREGYPINKPFFSRQLFLKYKNVDVSFFEERPLDMAIKIEDSKLFKILLSAGAETNYINTLGSTPLIEAVNSESPEFVVALLDAGADISMADKKGWTVLHNYPYGKSSPILDVILSRDASDINKINSLGYTPLMMSVMAEDKSATEVLLNFGANPCLISNLGNALEIGLSHGNCSFVDWLITEKECDCLIDTDRKVFCFAKNGLNPSEWQDFWNPNLSNDANQTPLIVSCKNGNYFTAVFLVSQDVDVNHADNYGKTAIHYSIGQPSELKLLDLLALSGADVNHLDFFQKSPLMTAVLKGSEDAVKFFLKIGVDIYYENERGESARSLAEINDREEILKLLNGEDVDK